MCGSKTNSIAEERKATVKYGNSYKTCGEKVTLAPRFYDTIFNEVIRFFFLKKVQSRLPALPGCAWADEPVFMAPSVLNRWHWHHTAKLFVMPLQPLSGLR